MKTINQMMDILLSNLTVELREAGKLDGLCVVNRYPGTEVAADYGLKKGCGGMAYLQLLQSFPTQSFPIPVTDVSNCGHSLAFNLDMGIMRPVAIPRESNNRIVLPTAEENEQSTFEQIEDMEIMHRAIRRSEKDIEHLILGTYIVEGPAGGLVIGHWGLTVGDDDF